MPGRTVRSNSVFQEETKERHLVSDPWTSLLSGRHALPVDDCHVRLLSNMAYDICRVESERTWKAMTRAARTCCSSPASIGYWFVVSLLAWAVLSLGGIFWRPFHFSSAATCFFAMAVGCFANWLKHRTLHCAITGPLFLIGGVILLLSGVRVIHVDTHWVWRFVLIGVGIALLLEWRYAQRSGHN